MGDATKAHEKLGWKPRMSVRAAGEDDVRGRSGARALRNRPVTRRHWDRWWPGDAPLVGVIMGSDSDLGVMRGAIDVLDEFGVPSEVRVVSAHRTPQAMYDYAQSAVSRGLRVIIAGAGGAAHLPGMTASLTPLPVIGVPVPLQHLDGLDSLLSIVQMPDGIPVATVAVGAAPQRGAARGPHPRRRPTTRCGSAWSRYQSGLADLVREKDAKLRSERPST